jgi:hypothetical protein
LSVLRRNKRVLRLIVGRIVAWCGRLLDSSGTLGARNIVRQWHRLDQDPWGEGAPDVDERSAPPDDPSGH